MDSFQVRNVLKTLHIDDEVVIFVQGGTLHHGCITALSLETISVAPFLGIRSNAKSHDWRFVRRLFKDPIVG